MNCPYAVRACFDTQNLDIENDNYKALQGMKASKFMPYMNAVLNCEVCRVDSGKSCDEAVSLDVIEVAIVRNLLPENAYLEYFNVQGNEEI